MNKIIENILTRRSVREYQDKKIGREELELITKAGQYAPSAVNAQTFQITVVQNEEVLEKLYTAIPKHMPNIKQPYNFYGAKTLVLVSDKTGKELGQMDCACVAENMMLAAHSLGIGSVWINQLRDLSDERDIRAALTKAGVPADHRVWLSVAMGYPKAPVGDKEKTAKIVFCE